MVKSIRRIAVNLVILFLVTAVAAVGYGIFLVALSQATHLLGTTLYTFLGYFVITYFAPFAYLLGAEALLRYATPDRQRLVAVLGAAIIPATALLTTANWDLTSLGVAFLAYLVLPALVLGLSVRLPPSRSSQPAESEG
jgi:hypothetical protein